MTPKERKAAERERREFWAEYKRRLKLRDEWRAEVNRRVGLPAHDDRANPRRRKSHPREGYHLVGEA